MPTSDWTHASMSNSSLCAGTKKRKRGRVLGSGTAAADLGRLFRNRVRRSEKVGSRRMTVIVPSISEIRVILVLSKGVYARWVQAQALDAARMEGAIRTPSGHARTSGPMAKVKNRVVLVVAAPPQSTPARLSMRSG